MTRPSPRALAELPADELVARLHPYDERTAQHTAAAARELAELVRYLNVATLDDPHAALPDPNTAASVLGALHTAATRLPQLLRQLHARVGDFETHPDLATGSSEDPAPVLAQLARVALDNAAATLGPFTDALGEAFAALDRLYLDVDDADEQGS